MKFSICENFAAKVFTCSPERLSQALNSSKTVGIRAEIARLQEKRNEGTISPSEFETKKAAAKKRSCCIMPHADFPSGRRCNEDAVASTGYGFDLDHMKGDPRVWYLQNVAGREEELGIGYAEVSLSGDGLHLIGLCPEGLDVEQSQRWLAKQLNIEEYDVTCKDLARCFFLSGNTLYRDDNKLFGELKRPVLEPKEVAEFRIASDDNDKRDTVAPVAPLSSDSYQGVPYSEIVKELLGVMGGEPQEGNRNNFVFRMVNCLRGICDNNQETLLKITPTFGLDETEMKNTIKSCTKNPVKGLCIDIRKTLSNLGITSMPKWRVDEDLIYLYTREVMNNLPKGLRDVLKNVPENKRMNVLCALLPVLATYAENVKFHHATGEEGHMAIMSAIIGEFGKGKSQLCMTACNLFLDTLNEQDKSGWEAIEKYQETQQTRSQNEKVDKKPHPVIRNIATVATGAYIIDRLKDSKGHCLTCVTDEVQDIISNPRDNAERSKILRKSFDQSVHTVGRVNKESITGKVIVRLNTTAMGTFNAMRTFFGDGNIENGLASRFIISFLPHEVGQQWLKVKPYDEKTREAALQLAQMLAHRKGEVKTPRIDKAIHQWWEEKNQLVVENNDEVLGALINRMAVIGHRCGVLFHLMTGKKTESKIAVKFALLMAEYTLDNQIRFFGKTLKKLTEDNIDVNTLPANSNKRLLNQLPATFTFDDAQALKPEVKPASVKRMLQRWLTDGEITNPSPRVYTKTPKD